MAAVARRVAEFGTLKAIGWRTRRIVAQALGESVAMGIAGAAQTHTVSVPLHPSVTFGVIVLAAALAVAGGLLAGSFGSWRIARLRPADALSRVA
jgi:putative ABC transport system permease protein